MVNLDKYSSIFIANWKLNGNSSFLKDYYEKLKVNSNNCTIICPPSIYLKSNKVNNENLFFGAQDVQSIAGQLHVHVPSSPHVACESPSVQFVQDGCWHTLLF